MKKISEFNIDPTDCYFNVRKKFRSYLTLTQGKRLWIAIGQQITKKKTGKDYIIDYRNVDLVTELIKWAIMDPSYKKDLQKGIWIMGDVGTGKTLTLRILSELMKTNGKNVLAYTSSDIIHLYQLRCGERATEFLKKEDVISRIQRLPLFIDDLGVEEFEVVNFGQKEHPIHSLFLVRHSTMRYIMFVSTNLDADKIELRYGARIRDRIRIMFNVYTLEGESFRI